MTYWRSASLIVAVLIASCPQAFGQQPATAILRSGESVSFEVSGLDPLGITVNRDGGPHRIPFDLVAAVDFTGGPIPDSQWNLLVAGRHVLSLRSGQVVQGRFTDVSSTQPILITFESNDGKQEYASSDVARLLLAPRAKSSAVSTASQTRANEGCHVVPYLGAWDGGNPWGDITLQAAGGCDVKGTFTGGGGGVLTGSVMPAFVGDVADGRLMVRFSKNGTGESGQAYAQMQSPISMAGQWCQPQDCAVLQGRPWSATKKSGAPPTTGRRSR